MIEFVQTIIRSFWELLLPIPMPWQAIIIFMLFMPVFSWLFWRAVPWLLAKLSPVLLSCVEFLAECLLWPEYWLAEYMRKRNRKPPVANYVFGDILGWMVSIADRVTQLLARWLEFTMAKRWQPRKVEYVVAIIALPLVWFVSPAFGKQSAVATLVDRGATWWCSLESWVMTGQWKAERQFCNYPGESTRISAADKLRIYRFRIELEKSIQAIQSYPRDPRAYANRGNLYLEQGYANEAFKDFTKAIGIDPYFAPGHSGRGDVYLMKRDKDAAFKEYTHAIRRDPEYAPGYKGRGDVYRNKGDKKAAIRQYQIAAELFQQQGKTEAYQEVIGLIERLR